MKTKRQPNIFLFANISDIPNTIDELNKKAPLHYNLDEQNKFQPLHMHIDVGGKPSSELIGRFTGRKQEDGKFKITKIEFKFFDISDNLNGKARHISAISAEQIETFDSDRNHDENFIKIGVLIKESEIKRPNHIVDVTLTKDIVVGPSATIDFHIIDSDKLYPINNTDIQAFRPRGYQCNGLVSFS